MKWGYILALTAVLVICVRASTSDVVRGVPPAEQSLFKGDTFACRREPTRRIPISHVNDNYCDCNDGSDEPGTSACKLGFFYCINKGHQGESIFSSKVNDGICDCCDGSDEWEGKVACTNTCDTLGAQVRKQQEEERKRYEEGLKIKEQWISEAEQGKKVKLDEIEAWKKEVERIKSEIEVFEAEKVVIEEKEKAERAVMAEAKEQREKEELAALEQLMKEGEPAVAEPAPAEENAPAEQATETTEGEHHEEAQPQEEVKEDEETAELKAILADKAKVEGDISNKRRELSEIERKMRENEDVLKLDFGTQSEFFALHGKCFDYKSREYTYTFCPYDSVKQSHTSLGKFENWEPAHTVMKFTNGQQCWGGPKRSAAISFSCGSQNELLSVSEPSKCEYVMTFTSPAACSRAHYEMMTQNNEAAHEEGYFF